MALDRGRSDKQHGSIYSSLDDFMKTLDEGIEHANSHIVSSLVSNFSYSSRDSLNKQILEYKNVFQKYRNFMEDKFIKF